MAETKKEYNARTLRERISSALANKSNSNSNSSNESKKVTLKERINELLTNKSNSDSDNSNNTNIPDLTHISILNSSVFSENTNTIPNNTSTNKVQEIIDDILKHKNEKFIIEFLQHHKENDNINELICDCAAYTGRLDILQYAHLNNYPWTVLTASCAAEKDNLDCLEYAHKNKCPWNDDIVKIAASNDSIKCLKYIINEKCCNIDDVANISAMFGSIRCLEYSHSQGIELNQDIIGQILLRYNTLITTNDEYLKKDLKPIEFFKDTIKYCSNIYPISKKNILVAIKQNSLDLLKYMIEELNFNELAFLCDYIKQKGNLRGLYVNFIDNECTEYIKQLCKEDEKKKKKEAENAAKKNKESLQKASEAAERAANELLNQLDFESTTKKTSKSKSKKSKSKKGGGETDTYIYIEQSGGKSYTSIFTCESLILGGIILIASVLQ